MKKILIHILSTGVFLSLALSSCKKEIIQEIEYPQHLLTGDIFLECKEYNPSEQDYISYEMINKRSCIGFKRPDPSLGNCDLELRKHEDNYNWYQFAPCEYRSLFSERTILRIYLAKPDLINNIKNLEIGEYDYYRQGDAIPINSNIFKITLIPVSASAVNRFGFGNLIDNLYIFRSQDAFQDSESFFRITQIETIQLGANTFKRFHLEFSCNLQDEFGRIVQLRNGEASFTLNLN